MDGDLTISGAFEFEGLILVRGAVRISGGGNKVFMGSIACLGSLNHQQTRLNGNLFMGYSSDALRAASDLASGYTILSWR